MGQDAVCLLYTSGSCSILLSYWRKWMEQVTGIEPASPEMCIRDSAMRGTPRSLGFRGIFCMIVTSGQTYATGGTDIPGKNISEKRGKGLTLRSFFV